MRFLAGARNDTASFVELRERGDLPGANLPFSSQYYNKNIVIPNEVRDLPLHVLLQVISSPTEHYIL
jgi:hypothetical protein